MGEKNTTQEAIMLLRWVGLFLLVISPVFGGHVGEAVAQGDVFKKSSSEKQVPQDRSRYTPATVLRVGHLIDPADGSVRHNQVIVVEGKKIVAVGEAAGGKVTIPSGATVVDLSRCLGSARLDGCAYARDPGNAYVGRVARLEVKGHALGDAGSFTAFEWQRIEIAQ